MGDDFDLFPKRENLDPFSFGKKEKSTETQEAEGGEELFGQDESAPAPLPDLPPDLPSGEAQAQPGPLPDLPLPGQAPEPPASVPEPPPLVPPPAPTAATPDAPADPLDSLLSDGPISEEKTFDEPVLEQKEVVEGTGKRGSKKSPSPFVVVGGALIIIIGLLYGALTYLKRDKAPVPVATLPAVTVPAPVPAPEPSPATVPETPQVEVPAQVQPPEETAEPEAVETSTKAVAVEVPEEKPVPAPEPEPAQEPAPQVIGSDGIQYSVQAGAFILQSSVAELEKKLRGLGYEPFLKEGSTTAMMNMLTVGPFNRVEDARAAIPRLTAAGVDTNMRRRNDGSAIINAGSYLLEENATSVMKKIRSLGYPVRLSKNEARLPMTFVRVGRYSEMNEATRASAELKGKGIDGIVVKLQ